MKKIVCLLLCLTMAMSMAACGNKETAESAQTDSGSSAYIELDEVPDTAVEKTLHGYDYIFPEDVNVNEAPAGSFVECKGQKLFIYGEDDIPFESWDTALNDGEEKMLAAVGEAFNFEPAAQTLESTGLAKNLKGENTMRVLGTFGTVNEETNETPFVIHYYVAEGNHLRFLVGITSPGEDITPVAEVADFLAQHLSKAEAEK